MCQEEGELLLVSPENWRLGILLSKGTNRFEVLKQVKKILSVCSQERRYKEGLEAMREMFTLMGGRCVMTAGMTPTQQWSAG